MIGEQSVPLDSETFRAGHRQFVENMDRLLGRLREAGIPTYVGTLASNERDQRPFATVHDAGADTTAWRTRIDAGRASADTALAVSAFEQAVRIDPGAAEGHYLLGRALLASGRPATARAAFVRATDRDALRFRAPEVFNRSIRRLAARHGATVVDVQTALRNASPVGIIGRETMMEHLHPNLEGYGRIADAFFDAAIAGGVAGAARPTSAGAAYRVLSPLDSLVGYLRLDQLTRTWPFRPGEEQPFRRGPGTEQEVVELARAYFEDRLQWQEATFRVAAHYEAAGRLERALSARRALVQAYPFVAQHLTALGSLHMRIAQERGRPEAFVDAETLFRAALERDPRDAIANSLLGALLINRGAPGDAVPFLETAVQLAPRDVQPLYNLAGAYALTGRAAEARTVAERVLALQPTHPGARALLTSLPG
jgi:Flp pilus assembly protein TadD